MSAYGSIAAFYDRINSGVDYEKWAAYIIKHFERSGRRVSDVLELACGTGTLSIILSEAGYDITAVDISEDMLSAARSKLQPGAGNPMFLLQDISRLDLYGTVDAAICCLDSVNYVTDASKLLRAFKRVNLFLNPGGIFIFDVNTIQKYMNINGMCFTSESDGLFCVWNVAYSPKTRACGYDIDVFAKEADAWSRCSERHRQRAYETDELSDMLKEAGFVDVRQYGELSFRRPGDGENRVFFTARKR